jgi:3-oxoacyl-[acyl-carrier-protein] synthase II
MSLKMNSALISGLGVICSVANNIEQLEASLKSGRSGYKAVEKGRFDLSDRVFRSKSGCIIDQQLYDELLSTDKSLLYEISLRAIRQAMEDANITPGRYADSTRVALCVGTSIGGGHAFMEWMRKIQGADYDYDLLNHNHSNIANKLAKVLGIKGMVSVIDTACASGGNAIGRAYDLIKNDRADIVIAGGVDIFTYLTYCGFNSVFAISPDECKPFDEQRKGLNLGDAAAFVVIENEKSTKRDKEIYAEVGGYAILNEAYHATAPHPDGIFALEAMRKALNVARLNVNQIDYINAHGTSTKANDMMEIKAIGELVGDHNVYVSSSKSMLGHCLGAAGSVEALITALAIKKGFIPPSINLENQIAGKQNIHLVKQATAYQINAALSNSFAFAGNMASILLKQYKYN